MWSQSHRSTIELSTCRPSAIVNNKDPVRVRVSVWLLVRFGAGLGLGLGLTVDIQIWDNNDH